MSKVSKKKIGKKAAKPKRIAKPKKAASPQKAIAPKKVASPKKAVAPTEVAGSDKTPPKVLRMRPVIGHDNREWWDRINEGQLPIQRCKRCGTLRHPPRPMCWKCQSLEWEHVAASGKGTVYSYVVVHRPEVPGYTYPLVVAVVELKEGTRIVSNLVGIDPKDVKIGMPVKVSIEAVDEELKLPLFRPAS